MLFDHTAKLFKSKPSDWKNKPTSNLLLIQMQNKFFVICHKTKSLTNANPAYNSMFMY